MTPTTPRPTLLQRLAGLFVAWQLVFIVAANVFFLLHQVALRQADGAPGVAITFLARALGPYAEATGQLQGWSLYAPDVPHRVGFVRTELRWADGRSVKLPARNEPDDFSHFFRAPGEGRLLNYELHLRLMLLTWTPEDGAKHADRWRHLVADELRLRGSALQAYLAWQRDRYLREHPGETAPGELILWVYLYDIGPPGQTPWSWPGPTQVPLARWRPGREPGRGTLPIEAYDPAAWPTLQFFPVPENAGAP
jgi:hypothetical protein